MVFIKPIDLSKNEPTFPWAKDVFARAANRVAIRSNRYPVASELAETEGRLLELRSTSHRHVKLFRGIDDCLDNLLHLYSGLRPVVFAPTFSGFLESLHAGNRQFDSINLGVEYSISPKMLDELRDDHLLLLANPANPTGTIVSHEVLQAIASRVAVLLVDEAYIDFAYHPLSFEPWAPENVLTYMSFSKAYCLASQRLGALYGSRDRVEAIRHAWPTRRISYPRYEPMDSFSIALIDEALNSSVALNCTEEVVSIRSEFANDLHDAGLTLRQSQGNFFILERYNHGKDLKDFLGQAFSKVF